MRTAHILNTFAGVLGLVAVVSSAPTLPFLGVPDDCPAPSTVTVTVTVPASSLKASTVYVTASATLTEANFIETSTTTLTRFATLSITETAPQTLTEYLSGSPISPVNDQLSSGSPYDFTITETTVLVITYVNLTPIPSSGSLTYTETPASSGMLNYVVENGTTYGLDGQTPAAVESYVYITSSVTVIPLPVSQSSPAEESSTLTIQSTSYSTQQIILTETLETPSFSTSQGGPTFASVGTGLPFSKISSGWNDTKTPKIGDSNYTDTVAVATNASFFAANGPTLVLYSSFNIYGSQPTISKSSLAAQSGFNAFSTSVSGHTNVSTFTTSYNPGTAASSATGVTALTSSHAATVGSLSYSAVQLSANNCTETQYTATSARAPFLNSTDSRSSQVASATSSVVASLSTSPLSPGLVHSSSSSLDNQTTPTSSGNALSLSSILAGVSSSSLPANCSAFSSFGSFTSAASGVVTTWSSTTSSTAWSTPSSCGENGDFTLNFDDIPPLSVRNQSENTVQPEPIFNPYHQFDFSDGFVVVPPPTDPYLPSSPPLLLEFIPYNNVNGTNPQAGPDTTEEGYTGQISNGDGDQTGCFRFNMYGASMGCDSTGPGCQFTFAGYNLDSAGNEVLVASQTIVVPACPALKNCQLSIVDLDNQFINLALIRINATVASQPKIWWMDDLRLGWYNNSCATGICRQTAHLA